MRSPSFFKGLFQTERRFASYDECPEIYYRFNDKDEYGPQKLVHFIDLLEGRPDEIINGRFSDETSFRSKAYFFDLWNRVPPSSHTIKRLTRARVPIDAAMTENRGREILRELLRTKPPTAKQVQHLKELGVDPQTVLNREQANELIGVQKAIIREKQREAAEAQQHVDDAPEVKQCLERLGELKTSVNQFLPGWKPPEFSDLDSLLSYAETVAEALEYATGFTLESLYGGPFFDPLKSEDYYLEFTRDPTADELRRFQADVFLRYLALQEEGFDHLKLLRNAFPSVKISLL